MHTKKFLIQQQLIHEMQSKDIHEIKVKQLVDTLHISRSTFYMYYDSIFDVLQDIEDSFATNVQNISVSFWAYPPNSHYLKEPHPIILKALQCIKDHKELAKVLWGPHGDPSFKIKCRKMIRHAFFPKHLVETSKNDDSLYQTAFMTGGHLELVNCWIDNDCCYDIEKLTILVYTLMYANTYI